MSELRASHGDRAIVRREGNCERGSALLIVFVFAAMVAIMLYMEMPVAVFEAQRQKEQLLIDRGNEYAHAVKLFMRKVGRYPASLEQLEDTNRMRFLRHRFKDPFTGKDDWRLLHAGPNGVLIDSKVKPLNPAQNGTGGNSAAGFGSSANSSFGSSSSSFGSSNNSSGSKNSSFGSSSSFGSGGAFGSSGFGSTSSDTEKVVQPIPQRPPAIAANGSAQTAANSQNDPFAPLMTPEPNAEAGNAPGQQNPSASSSPTNLTGTQPGNPSGNRAGATGTAGSILAPIPGTPGQSGQPGSNGQEAQSGAPPAGTPAGAGAATGAMQAVGGLMTNPNPIATQNNTFGGGFAPTTGTTGVLNSGGIAGVASKASGHSIKVINDQEDYSLWEFYYDPSKDSARGLRGAQAALQRQGQGQNQNAGSGFFQSATPSQGQNSSTTSSVPPIPQSTRSTGTGPP